MSVLAGVMLSSLPAFAAAQETVSFDFAQSKINAEWQALGPITVEHRTDGLLLTTGAGTGMLVTDDQLTFFPQTAEVIAVTTVPTPMKFIWSNASDPDERTAFIDMVLKPGQPSYPLLLSRSPDWLHDKRQMGILLLPHSSVLLQHIHFTRWELVDHIVSFMRSWTVFDTLRPYTINFVWGPHIGWNPEEVRMLYKSVPPIATSVVWIMSIGLTILFFLQLIRHTGLLRSVLSWCRVERILIIVAACWILLDLYMGLQYLSWVHHDHNTYISQPTTSRTFRDRTDFYDFGAAAAKLVQDRETYIFMSEVPWPFLGNMRYITYPSIPAFRVGIDDTWIIFERSEMDVSSAGELTFNGDPVTHPGEILLRTGPHTMVFRGSPLPIAQE